MISNSHCIIPERGLRPLSSELQRIAIEELNEVSERVNEDIQKLRDWLLKQPHLKTRTSDQFLVAFLRSCKFSLEKAKTKIDKYYSLRRTIPEIYKERDLGDPKIVEIIKTGVVLRLPIPEGYSGPVISIIRVAAYDLNKYKFPEIIRVGMMIGDIIFIKEDNIAVSGMIEIMDMTNLTANHLFHLNLSFLKRCSIYTDEGMPFRHKGIHFISTVPQFTNIFNTVKCVMGPRNNKKIQIHGSDMEGLYKCVPKDLLPIEYGGKNGTINEIIEHWVKEIMDYRDFLEEEKLYGSYESLCPGEPLNFGNLNGSFRMLCDVD